MESPSARRGPHGLPGTPATGTEFHTRSDIIPGVGPAAHTPGELLRARRRAHGLSQARLARRAATSQAAISRIERDQVSPSTATLEGLLAVMGEDLWLSARRAEPEWDRAHMADILARTPAERLELAIGWNRLAGEVAAAGAAARER